MANKTGEDVKIVILKPFTSSEIIVEMCLKMLSDLDIQRANVYETLKGVGYDFVPFSIEINPKLVLRVIHSVFGIDVITAKGRTDEIALARFAARHLLNKYTTLSTNKIAGLTGVKDHTSVLRSLKMIPSLKKSVAGFEDKLNFCINYIKSDIKDDGKRKINFG